MLSQDYKRFNISNVTASYCNLSLTYANLLWDKNTPTGGFEYKIKHTGISIRYDREIKEPTVFGLCIPKSLYKTLLANFNFIKINTKQFIISRTKKCDGCRYCVQTDKTNTRPFAYIKVNCENEDYNLCPYFPGYSYCWTSINNELVEQLIDMLTLMDKYIKENKN